MPSCPANARILARQFPLGRGLPKHLWLAGGKDEEEGEGGKQRIGGEEGKGGRCPLSRGWEALGVREDGVELLGPSVQDM